MEKQLYNHIFCNSDIKYDILGDEKEVLDNFCKIYDILDNKQEVDNIFVNVSPNIIIKLLNMLPKLNNDKFETILINILVYDINNNNIEDFAKKYNLSLDDNINICQIIELINI